MRTASFTRLIATAATACAIGALAVVLSTSGQAAAGTVGSSALAVAGPTGAPGRASPFLTNSHGCVIGQTQWEVPTNDQGEITGPGACWPLGTCPPDMGWFGASPTDGTCIPDNHPASGGPGTYTAPPIGGSDPNAPSSSAPPQVRVTVTTASVATPTATVGMAVRLTIHANSSPAAVIDYTGIGLPAGLSINPATGVITGTPTKAFFYGSIVTATAQGNVYGATSASVYLPWTVTAPAKRILVPRRAPRINGTVALGGRVHVAAMSPWKAGSRTGATIHPKIRCRWYLNGRWRKSARTCTLTIPRGRVYAGMKLQIRVTAAEHGYPTYSRISAARVIRQ